MNLYIPETQKQLRSAAIAYYFLLNSLRHFAQTFAQTLAQNLYQAVTQ